MSICPTRQCSNMPSSTINVVQVEEKRENIEDQVKHPMEQDDKNNIVQDDGRNKLIQDLFNQPFNDEDEGNDDNILDEPLLEKKHHFMKDQKKIFFAIVLSLTLKVLNGLKNPCITEIPRHVICFITYYR